MKQSAWLWIIAIVLTLVSARWQRLTGPTHELPGDVLIGGRSVHYVLQRTHKGPGGQVVEFNALPDGVAGTLEWKRLGSREPWTVEPMVRDGGALRAHLPHVEPGVKLWYRVRLVQGGETALVPPLRPAAIRYTGSVPPFVLIPHIILMFLAMLLSMRAGLEVFVRAPRLGALTYWNLAVLVVGGIALGVLVTHYAFGLWWTGWPLGNDLTDNKTLIAVIAWLAASLAVGRARLARAWVGVAALITLVIFVIPHSWTAAEPLHAGLEVPGAAIVPTTDSLAPAPAADTSTIPGDLPAKR
jgi:hypothetical protein